MNCGRAKYVKQFMSYKNFSGGTLLTEEILKMSFTVSLVDGLSLRFQQVHTTRIYTNANSELNYRAS